MERIIKFRGKLTGKALPLGFNKGDWWTGFYYEDLHCGEWKSFIKCGELDLAVDKDTVCQFTGLLDKNGKEIYEGDIMNDPTSMCVGVVEWNCILCQFQLSWQNMHTAADLFFMAKCGSFVIGNIHDNPEMRKGGAK